MKETRKRSTETGLRKSIAVRFQSKLFRERETEMERKKREMCIFVVKWSKRKCGKKIMGK